jgi:carotenoid 1,2-hydratase
MVGHPFSPDYLRAGRVPAERYCSMNVAVYGPRPLARLRSGFALEERAIPSCDRAPDGIQIGRSSLRWVGDRLQADLDERTTPLGHPFRRAIKGRVTFVPEALTGRELVIDRDERHLWWPVSPVGRIEVDLPSLGLRFRGHGYHDANAGETSLADGFEHWSWSRARTSQGAALTYDAIDRSGTKTSHAFRVRAGSGNIEPIESTGLVARARSAWGLPRGVRVDAGASVHTIRTLEDGPFYDRELIETRVDGEPVTAMYEALSGRRLRAGWVRFLTGYRMAKA